MDYQTQEKIYQELTGFKSERTDSPEIKAGETLDPYYGLAEKNEAANIIQKSWKAYRMTKTFLWLRHMLFKTERMLSKEVLKRLSPNEAILLTDPALKVNVRFRLGGEAFPPIILFKIYTSGMNVHYFNGQDNIRAGSKAAEDSFTVMGSRCFQEKILFADLQKDNYKISRAYEVTDKLEFIQVSHIGVIDTILQYMNTLDKKPAHLGGRSNNWRELKVTQSMIQGVILEGKDQRFQTPPSLLASKLSAHATKRPKEKYQAKLLSRTGKEATDIIDLEDDFGILFDWITHLDEKDLGDFHELQGLA